MKQKSGMIGVVYAAILSAIAGYFFRMTQLSGGSSVPLIAFSILMVFVFALAAVSLEKQSAYEAVYRPSGQDLTFSLLGALGLIAGCVLSFRGSIAQMLVSLLGLLAGLSLGAGAVLRWKKKAVGGVFRLRCAVLCCEALPRFPPLGDQSCDSGLLLLAVRHDRVHAGKLSRGRVQL
ncbi:MAG: hypothetical protein ACLS3C_15615 [Oscillospiraceae bacterium]